MTRSFRAQMVALANTKRAQSLAGGQRTVPQPYLSNIPCVPLTPRGVEAGIDSHEGLETFLPGGTDVVRGDLLVIGGITYSVTEADAWPWVTRHGRETFVHVVVEDQVR